MLEYGGYLPLELNEDRDYYSERYSVLKLNSGRAALAVAIIENKIKKIWIPYYNCSVVYKMLSQFCNCQFYYLDNNLNPMIDKIEEDEWILIVNYFGNRKNSELIELKKIYKTIIIDNTQGFFAEPISDCFNVYSCRKFFGVSDGAYLVTDKEYKFKSTFKKDISWKRCSYLMRSIDEGTNSAYSDSLLSEENIGYNIYEMSRLTDQIMKSINYTKVLRKRRNNQRILMEELDEINQISVKINSEDLIAYPLLIKNEEFRMELIKNKIYVPQWWKYLKEIVKKESIEYEMSNYLTMIPLDQRYEEKDIYDMIKLIKNILANNSTFNNEA